MATIKTIIRSVNDQIGDAQMNLIFEITNAGPKDFYVLKRNTPLEGLKSDCLDVRVNGKQILYDGYFLKRALPNPEDYVLIGAGETVAVPIEISVAYDVSQPGMYNVKFDESKLVILPAGVNREDFSKMKSVVESFAIENSGEIFKVNEGKAASITVGAAMRKSKKKVIEGQGPEAFALQQPVIKGGSTEQKKIVKNAHEKGYEFTATAVRELGNNQQYILWFGSHDSSRETIVKDNYSKIKKMMESMVFTYDLDGSECDDSTFAYTTHGSSTIWLCTQFWKAKATGFNSQAGTMVHEHSHATAFTEDLVYGEEECKKLAALHPNQSINNADSYEYFTESCKDLLVKAEIVNDVPLSV